ncbi:MAG TPA: VWA domain-containing protein, partial [Pirellulales bacterium]|nr:VWA domain-containing protein [Pirellulales bacterium]
ELAKGHPPAATSHSKSPTSTSPLSSLPPPLPKSPGRRRQIAAAVGGGALLAGVLLLALLALRRLPAGIGGEVGSMTGGSGANAGTGTGAVAGNATGNATGDATNGAAEGAQGNADQANTGDANHRAQGATTASTPGPQTGAGAGVDINASDGKVAGDNAKPKPAKPQKAGAADAAGPPAAGSPPPNAQTPTLPPAAGNSPKVVQKRARPPRAAAVIRPLEDDPTPLTADGNADKIMAGGSSRFFDVRARGRKFVYVVDCSDSMQGDRFERATQELLESIDALRPNQSFYVIFFADREYCQCYPAEDSTLTPATKSNKQRIAQWVADFTYAGGTYPFGALGAALGLEPDAIFLLSDGEFDDDVPDCVKTANISNIPIHTIAFMDPIAAPLLKRIAKENNGIYRYVP